MAIDDLVHFKKKGQNNSLLELCTNIVFDVDVTASETETISMEKEVRLFWQ